MASQKTAFQDHPSLDPVVQSAIEWMVLLRSGTATRDDALAFENWRQADVRHQAACLRIEQTLGYFCSLSNVDVPKEVVHTSLLEAPSRRRALRNILGLAVLGTGIGATTLHSPFYQRSTADLHTAIGQRQTNKLIDGSRVTLNARTALNMSTLNGMTTVQLLTGEVLVRRTSDNEHDLLVGTREGWFQARRGIFSVRQNENQTRINVLEDNLRVKMSKDLSVTTVLAGQTVDVGSLGSKVRPKLSPYAETAWVDGKLQVDNRRLSDVASALSDYWQGFIYITAAAASLRVSGVFPLNDVPFTLSTLAQNMPIVVRHIGSFAIIDVA